MKIGAKGKKVIAKVGLELMKVNFIMNQYLKWGEKVILKNLVEKNERNRPIGAQQEKYYIVRNLMKAFERKLRVNALAPGVKKFVFDRLIGDVIINWRERHPEAAARRDREDPLPLYVVISPTQKCNLACIGCYAASSNKTFESLDWDTVDEIMRQKRELWGSYFTVISGGEPLMWESNGKTILDLYEKYNDTFFLMYTNGTLIDRATAKRFAELGNVAPAISVEGFEEDTDYRRGKGVYKKILKAIDHLRDEGVLYGISFTATRLNADNILHDDFIDEFFDTQGAAFAWMFQYMPIGRKPDFELMLTSEQRRNLWFREQHLIKEKGIFFVDFWNGGPISDGCICAGRKGGYMYFDWSGNVMPCVFIPYSVGNINRDFFAKGKTLNDVLATPFFTKLREWQAGYSYKKPASKTGNEITPCPIRDHHDEFHKIAETTHAIPVGKSTEKAFQDQEYVNELTKIGKEAHNATIDIWKKEYQKT